MELCSILLNDLLVSYFVSQRREWGRRGEMWRLWAAPCPVLSCSWLQRLLYSQYWIHIQRGRRSHVINGSLQNKRYFRWSIEIWQKIHITIHATFEHLAEAAWYPRWQQLPWSLLEVTDSARTILQYNAYGTESRNSIITVIICYIALASQKCQKGYSLKIQLKLIV